MKRLHRMFMAAGLTVALTACAVAGPRDVKGDAAARQAEAGGEPALPTEYLDTTMPAMRGRKLTVSAAAGAAGLQAALQQARSGDEVVLEAGATFTGNFTLPARRAAPGEWVVIRSSAADQLTPGRRVTPEDARLMAKIVTSGAAPALKTAPRASGYRLIGLEFTVAEGVPTNYGVIQLGASEQTSLDEVPRDIVIDRCYIHGTPQGNVRRGVALNSARTAIIDSHISDCHEVGADSQAICGWNGPGPFKIVNNYLEGAGENVMFGGSDPKVPNLVPSDIEFRRNHCFKPLAWKKGHPEFAGKAWTVKNLFELKNARRVLVDGNLFEHNWVDGQDGFAILFTVRNQSGGAPWSVVEDITFTNNVVRRSAAGVNILGRDNLQESQPCRRIRIYNNLFDEIGGAWGKVGHFLKITEGTAVVIDHNTILHSGNITLAYGKPTVGFVFTNNLLANNAYGVIGDGTGPGRGTLDKYFPGAVFKKNVIAGGRASLYPAENFFPASLDEAGLTGRAQGDLRLAASSPFGTSSTDGRSVGADLSAIEAAAQAAEYRAAARPRR